MHAIFELDYDSEIIHPWRSNDNDDDDHDVVVIAAQVILLLGGDREREAKAGRIFSDWHLPILVSSGHQVGGLG